MRNKLLNKPGYIFYSNEIESANFLLDELTIIFIMSSGSIWITFYLFNFLGLFTFIAIQFIFIVFWRFSMKREKRRIMEAKEILQLINYNDRKETLEILSEKMIKKTTPLDEAKRSFRELQFDKGQFRKENEYKLIFKILSESKLKKEDKEFVLNILSSFYVQK